MSNYEFYPFNYKGVVSTEGNRVVLRTEMGHLCGYVLFTPDQLPVEWHGDYNADALQYLAIHGGLTYAEVQGVDEDARLNAMKQARESVADPDESMTLEEKMDRYSERREKIEDAKMTVPYEYVVFGFDCAHYGDEENYMLRDPDHVMGLVRQMENQILEYAKVVDQWREADRDTRISMIEAIIEKASVKTELGFGALIGVMGGAPEFGAQS